MATVHVECRPDEALVKKLGITNKKMVITHHYGKSRVFHKLTKTKNEIGMVDEDPGSAKTQYERNLKFIEEVYGIKRYSDKQGNKVLVLKVKLEDWIIAICKTAKIDITKFGLPNNPNELHDVIINRINNFEKLIDHLKKNNNPSINKLQSWLN